MFIASCSACTFVLAYNSIWFCRSCISFRSRGTRERILISFNRREKLRFFCEDCKLAAFLLRYFSGALGLVFVYIDSSPLGLLSTLGTRGFSRVRREFSVSAKGRGHERRSREKNLWHGAVLFTVPVDLWAFLLDYIYANQIGCLTWTNILSRAGLFLSTNCSVCPSGGRWEPISRLVQNLDQLI